MALDWATYGATSFPTISSHPIWSNRRSMDCHLAGFKRMSFSARAPALWYLIIPEIRLPHHHHVGFSQGPKNWIAINHVSWICWQLFYEAQGLCVLILHYVFYLFYLFLCKTPRVTLCEIGSYINQINKLAWYCILPGLDDVSNFQFSPGIS